MMLLQLDSLCEAAQHDIVIVGAGAVGLCMAVKLTRIGRRVLVLEAGPERLNNTSQEFFSRAKNVGHAHSGLALGRFRVLGGTTNFWGGQLVPFEAITFEPRPWVDGGLGWPVRRADLDTYYGEALDLLGMSKVLSDEDLMTRLNIHKPSIESGLDYIFTRWVPEANLSIHFEQDIRCNPNLQIVTTAQVTALHADGGAIAGLTASDGNQRRTVGARQVILANGTIEIARLLSLPLAGGRSAPWSANAFLGHGFMDHVDCNVGSVHPIDKRRFHQIFDNAMISGLKYQPKLKLSEASQAEKRLLGIAGHFIFKSSLSENFNNVKILAKAMLKGRLSQLFKLRLADIKSLIAIGLPMTLRYLRYRRIYAPSENILLRLLSEQISIRESRILLLEERDAFDMPVVALHWKIDGREIETFATFAEMAKTYLEENGLARIDLDARLVARDPAFLDEADDGLHHMGMARMSRDAASGVVDSNLRVYGADNLYVAGAAVFPSTGFANPTFTAIALGLRLCEHMAAKQ